jgi:hypothetical protein
LIVRVDCVLHKKRRQKWDIGSVLHAFPQSGVVMASQAPT